MNKKIFYIVILIFSFISTLFANTNSVEKISVQLNWKYQFEFAGFIAAKEKGFYEKVGLDVDLREYKPDTDVVQEVLSQRANYGISNSNIILDKGSISPAVLLATYLQKSPLILVTKPNIKNLLDLVGKNIMGAKDELKYSSLALLFEHFNINSSNSNIISHTFNIDDFVNGKVDVMSAFKSNQIYELDKRKIAYNIIDPADYGFIVSGINLYSSINEAKDNYDRTARFIEASNRGWKYAIENQEEIVDLLKQKYGVLKSKEALLFEANVVKQLVMSDFIPIGKVSSDFTQRLLKQLIYAKTIENEANVGTLVFDKDSLFGDKKFTLTKKEKEYLDSKESLKLCVAPSQVPIEYIKDSELQGVTKDIIELFEQKLDKAINLVPTKSWSESIEFFKNRECDIISSISPNDERKLYMDFTKPVLSLPLVLATRIDKPFIQNSSFLNGKEIAILKGHFFAEHIKLNLKQIKLVEVLSIQEGLDHVAKGVVYGYVDNSLVLAAIQKEYANSLKFALKFDMQDDLCLATRNDEPLLGEIFNKLVDDLDESKKQEFLNNWTPIVKQVGWLSSKEIVVISFFIFSIIMGQFVYHRKVSKLNEKLKRLSITDKLTNIYNRFELDKIMEQEKNKIDRNSSYHTAIIMLDIDYFKSINDTYGHLVGDMVLVSIAKLLKSSLRNTDTIGRWGGEEFLIILPFTTKESAVIVAQNLRDKIAKSDILKEHDRVLTASFGVESMSADKTINDVLIAVDELLYRAKNSGRNRVECDL